MNKKILVINAGSSSIKFKVFELESMIPTASGLCERIYVDGAFELKFHDKKFTANPDFKDHTVTTEFLINQLLDHKVISNVDEIVGFGHRVVQGGEVFKDSAKITENDIDKIKMLAKLAPLHNPGAAAAMEAFFKLAPHAVNVAVFDTSFHQTMPAINYLYAVPLDWYKNHDVRRYGMHGTSFRYINMAMKEVLNDDAPNLIVCHLGNGASLCAIKNGHSYNTSMGLTPLAGLVMGSRSGDIDPSIIEYMTKETGKSVSEITNELNKKSGFIAYAPSPDMRDIQKAFESNDENTQLIMKIWAKRIADYILQYANDLDGDVDGIIFTAGIGENSVFAREKVINAVKILGLELDKEANAKRVSGPHKISTQNSSYPIYVVPTDEELLIARDTKKQL